VNLYLDIETIPDGSPDYEGIPDPASIVVMHEEVEPDKRLKNPEKIAADIERKRAALQDERREAATKARDAIDQHWKIGSLEPLRGRVLCVGIAVEDGGPKVLMEDTEEATLELLERGLVHYRAKAGGRLRIWTWNGGRFDRPFLARRALKHRLYDLASMMRVAKPWEADDLYSVWGMGNQRSRGSLDAVCDFLGIGRDNNPISGADVLDRYQAGDLDAIREHCIDDVRVLQLIGREFDRAGWLQ